MVAAERLELTSFLAPVTPRCSSSRFPLSRFSLFAFIRVRLGDLVALITAPFKSFRQLNDG
jgi:hypothetical protein